MEEIKIRASAYHAKVDALIEALEDHQRPVYREAMRRIKEAYLHNHPELDAEQRQLVEKYFY